MVNGVVYSTAGSQARVAALDAGTGGLTVDLTACTRVRARGAPARLSGRGRLAYWSDGTTSAILYVTPATG